MSFPIDRLVFFKPNGLSKFKSNLFDRVAAHLAKNGAQIVRGDIPALEKAVIGGRTPVVGCMPEIRFLIDRWIEQKVTFVYWDRGYYFRIFATWLPRDDTGTSGYYRYTINGFQMRSIRDVPNDRYNVHPPPVRPWFKGGKDIVIAIPTETFEKFHHIEGWTDRTIRELAKITDRRMIVREKQTKRPLQADLENAYCLISHGSNTAVEAVILGVPVIVDPSSAAALVGRTKLKDIDNLVYPDRTKWLHSLAYGQFLEHELTDGTVWRHIA